MASTILQQILENISRGARLPGAQAAAAQAAAPTVPIAPAVPVAPIAPAAPATPAAPVVAVQTAPQRAPAPMAAPPAGPAAAAPLEDAGALLRVVIDEVDLRLARLVERVLTHPALRPRPATAPAPAPAPAPSGPRRPPVNLAPEGTEPIDVARAARYHTAAELTAVNPRRALGTAAREPKTEALDPERIAAAEERFERLPREKAKASPSTSTAAAKPAPAVAAPLRATPSPAAPAPAAPVPAAARPSSTGSGSMTPDAPNSVRAQAAIDAGKPPLAAKSGASPSPPTAPRPIADAAGSTVKRRGGESSCARLAGAAGPDAPSTPSIAGSDPSAAARSVPAASPTLPLPAGDDTDEVHFVPSPDLLVNWGIEDETEDRRARSKGIAAIGTPASAPPPSTGIAEKIIEALDGPGRHRERSPVVPMRGESALDQVGRIVEEIAATCATTPSAGPDGTVVIAPGDRAALEEIRELLVPLQQLPELLERQGTPNQAVLEQMQKIAREMREIARTPGSPAATEVDEHAAHRRRVSLDDIQGIIESLP